MTQRKSMLSYRKSVLENKGHQRQLDSLLLEINSTKDDMDEKKEKLKEDIQNIY